MLDSYFLYHLYEKHAIIILEGIEQQDKPIFIKLFRVSPKCRNQNLNPGLFGTTLEMDKEVCQIEKSGFLDSFLKGRKLPSFNCFLKNVIY